MVEIAQGATQMFDVHVDARERQISYVMIRRRALRAAPDQGLRYVFLNNAGFRR